MSNADLLCAHLSTCAVDVVFGVRRLRFRVQVGRWQTGRQEADRDMAMRRDEIRSDCRPTIAGKPTALGKSGFGHDRNHPGNPNAKAAISAHLPTTRDIGPGRQPCAPLRIGLKGNGDSTPK